MDLYEMDTHTASIFLETHASNLEREGAEASRLLHPLEKDPVEEVADSSDYAQLEERWIRLNRQEAVTREFSKAIHVMRVLIKASQGPATHNGHEPMIRFSHEDLYRMGLLSDEGVGQATIDALYRPLRERRESLPLNQDVLDALSQLHVYGRAG